MNIKIKLPKQDNWDILMRAMEEFYVSLDKTQNNPIKYWNRPYIKRIIKRIIKKANKKSL